MSSRKADIATLGHPVIHINTGSVYVDGLHVTRSKRIWQHRGLTYIETPCTVHYSGVTLSINKSGTRDLVVWDGKTVYTWNPMDAQDRMLNGSSISMSS